MSVDVNADGQQNSSVVDSMQISPGEKHKKVRYRKNMKIGVGGFIARTGRQRSIADKNMAPPSDGTSAGFVRNGRKFCFVLLVFLFSLT